VLCVNSLAPGQEELSGRFAGRSAEADMTERFSHASWGLLETGSPVLDGAAVSFDCRIAEVVERGTHSVIFAEVVAVRQGCSVARPDLVQPRLSRDRRWVSGTAPPFGTM
jgi:flavin reductase